MEAVRRLRADLSRARSEGDAWEALVEAAEPLGFQRLRLARKGTDEPAREWARPHPAREGTARLAIRLGAEGERAPRPVLEIEKRPFRRGMGLPDELFGALLEELVREIPQGAAKAGARHEPEPPALRHGPSAV
jgi:hypothetical protein